MTNAPQRIAALSPEKRALLLRRLKAREQQAVSPQGRGQERGQVPPLRAYDRSGENHDPTTPFPLSFAQQRLWFLHQLEPESSVYNMSSVLHAVGTFSLLAFSRSVATLIQRHEAFRTTFPVLHDQPVQVVAARLSLSTPLIDLGDLDSQEQERQTHMLVQQEEHHLFDLAAGPLFRSHVLRIGRQDHLLLFVMHHIISDGWSTRVLEHEFTVLYQAYATGQTTDPLPPLPLQYRDYALWQSEFLQGEMLQEQLDYWQQQLKGAPEALNLPTDHPRPAVQTYRGALQEVWFSQTLTAQLLALGRQENVTLFMLLLATLQVLLARYSGQSDICIGSPIANRRHPQTEGLIGFFVNTLVLRTNLGGSHTFSHLLQQVLETCLQAYAHQDIPFEKVVEALQPVRDLNRTPLFQVMLVLQNTSLTTEATRRNHATSQVFDQPQPFLDPHIPIITPLTVQSTTSKFDLTFSFTESPRGLHCTCEYSTDLFEADTIARMLANFQTLLEGVVQDPQARLFDLPLLPAVEQKRLLVEWNATHCDYPQDLCVHQLFEQQVERTPDTVALVCGDEVLTYAELNRRTNQLAYHLREQRIGPDRLVGICMERCIEMVISLLAVLKAGGAYVPLDSAYPQGRLAWMLADSQVAIVLTRSDGAGHLPPPLAEGRGKTIDLDADWKLIATRRQDNPSANVIPLNLAYVIYTSGSTGKPKGTLVTHRNVTNFFAAMNERIGDRRPGIWLAVTSISFDISVLELLWTLTQGFQVVVQPQRVDWSHLLLYPSTEGQVASEVCDRKKTVEALPALIERWDITHLQCTPSLAQLFLLESGIESALGSLQKLLLGGEALPLALVKQLGELVGGEIHNMYGPTETTIWSTTQSMEKNASAVSLGRPIANTQVYILDVHWQLLPVGVPGELFIGGDGVARGYLHQPEMTAEKFVPNPFATQPGACMYRTGDLVRYRPDGSLEYLGRMDNQVKIRGWRIELGEIEATLMRHPCIQECVVLVREDVRGEKSLIAYPVVRAERTLTIRELRSYLQDHLPAYLIPSTYVFLDALPRTPNGKIDRVAIGQAQADRDKPLSLRVPTAPMVPVPEESQSGESGAGEEARTPIEELLVQLWSEVLRRPQIGIHENFFELGGHSLLATQVVARIRRTFQVDLPLRSLFEAPTIARLSLHLEELMRGTDSTDIPVDYRLLPLERPSHLPLSFAQRRLWFLHQLEPQSALYNVSSAFRLTGNLHAEALEWSLAVMVQRHEVLRTTFPVQEGQPLQVVTPSMPIQFSVIDFQSIPADEVDCQVDELARIEAHRPFDLTHGPLLHVYLLRLASQGHILLFTLHHIVSDAWSTRIFMHEIALLYQARLNGEGSPLPALPIQYADYTLWQRQWLQGEVLQSQLAYWRKQLTGTPALLELPTDRPRKASQSYAGAKHALLLASDLFEQLKGLSQQEGVTLFMTLLATFQVLLMRYSGQADIVVGTPIANRTREELEGLIGFFVNTLVLRTDLSGNPSFQQLLARVREVALQAYMHQDVPFEKLVEELQPERDLSRQPLFQIIFSLEAKGESPTTKFELPGLSARLIQVESQIAKCDLSLILREEQAGLWITIEYSTDLFDASTIKRLLNHWQVILEEIVRDPGQLIEAIPLLTESEQEQLLQWNATQVEYPLDGCVHLLFENQVQRIPDAVALVSEEQILTYAELNRRANQLAHHLQTLGVGPEVVVGVFLPRSLQMGVGLLGILKAGGAYLPLDPTYPPDRLAFMLEHAQVPVLITNQHLRTSIPSESTSLVLVDADASVLAQSCGTDPQTFVASNNLAYIIYTSGSTGRPKGVSITHANLLNLVFWHQQAFDIACSDRATQLASPAFDAMGWEVWPYLAIGASVFFLTNEEIRSTPSWLCDWLMRHAITRTFLPTALAESALSQQWPSGTVLRFLLTGADALHRFPPSGLPFALINNYGPTEASVVATSGLVSPREEGIVSPSIGGPIANMQISILDKHLQPMPIGVPGELYIGGAGLARGYCADAELTAEKFLPRPFIGTKPWASPGERLYRTGDLARYRPDGSIEFLGRIDSQVKLRGFRIELGEIEATLQAHPSVQEAIVVLREEEQRPVVPTRKYLVAYVVPATSPLAPVGDALTPVEAELAPALQEYLHEQLPDYMIPAVLVFLERMPLTPTGKVDRQTLRQSASSTTLGQSETPFVAPRSGVEHTLASIWQQVLGMRTPVSIHENFFALGGDSILSMQIIARVRQAGWHLTPKQIFQHQTIAQLALVAIPAGALSSAAAIEPAPTSGLVSLTPIQHWFFEQDLLQPQHFNQAVLLQLPSVGRGQGQGRAPAASLQVPTALVRQYLQRVVDAWLVQHDALRLRYQRTTEGWRQRLISVTEAGPVPIKQIDLSQIEGPEQTRTIEEVANHVQASLDLQHGPLLRVVLFDLENGKPARLLIVIHHLIVDGVSWRVLLSDLQTAMPQLCKSEPLVLPPRTTSFQHWAEHVRHMAQSAFLQKERAYWLKVTQTPTAPLPVELVGTGQVSDHRLHDGDSERCNTQTWARTVRTTLTVEETHLLLHDALRPYHCHVQELLLVALLRTLARWMGTHLIRLDLEGHGREELEGEPLDSSRTIGWFTSLYPVLFTLPREEEEQRRRSNGLSLPTASTWIKAIKEQLRAVPHKGIGYGLLRYLYEDQVLQEQLAAASPSQVSFNYLGQFDAGGGQTSALINPSSTEEILQLAPESSGEAIGPQNRRSHLIDVNAMVSGGQFHFQWTYSEQLHRHTTIEKLAHEVVQTLRELLAHCLEPGTGGFTPSDFFAGQAHKLLDQVTLDRLSAVREGLVEDLYPLTPLQQGMLFHTLAAPRSGFYIEQAICRLRGDVDVEAFERAWQQVIKQQAILRTAFVWQELDEPLQIVFKQVKMPLNVLDWRDLSPQQQEVELEAFLQADRAQGFDLDQVPLMRVTFIKMAGGTEMAPIWEQASRLHMIWTHHHLLLDGWSVSLLQQELLACYEAETQGRIMLYEERRPYRDYISWLVEQESEAAEAYWRQALVGASVPTPLGIDQHVGKRLAPSSLYAKEAMQVEAVTAAHWQEYARQQQVTLHTLVQAAWALVLSRYSGRADVVFGTVVAGRPPELAGVERMIGLFINTVPVRVQVHDEEEVGVWLRWLQERQLEQRSYEYSSLGQIQGWYRGHRSGENSNPTSPYGIPQEASLFESLLVFENYPVQVALTEQNPLVDVGDGFAPTFQVVEQTNYPLTIGVIPPTEAAVLGESKDRRDDPLKSPRPLLLRVSYDCQRFERAAIERLLLHMQTVLQQLIADPSQRLAEVSLLTELERKQLLAPAATSLVEWNATSDVAADTRCDYQQDLCLHQLFELQVARTPDAIAVVSEGAYLSYQELNTRANQLACLLQQMGTEPDTLVGICLERSLELIIGLLAILKAGAAYLPLDPSYPAERLAWMLRDAQPVTVLSQTHLIPALPASPNPFVCLDTEWGHISQEPPVNPTSSVTPQNLAYVIYTSGSTGSPKGVMSTHRGLCNTLLWCQQTYQLSQEDGHLQRTSLSFDPSLRETFWPLIAGARVVMTRPEKYLESSYLVSLLTQEAITVVGTVPSVLQLLISEGSDWSSCQNVRLVTSGGETLSPELQKRFFASHRASLQNLYGPTEAAIDVTFWSCQPEEASGRVPIGHPIANTQIYLLDKNLQPVPIGIPAELYIGGANLARGYLNRPDLTAERFVPHPWASQAGERLYRTGDLAQYRADGALEYLGRIDQQIKLRGFRIEPGEIEASLQAHPAVREAVVVLREETETRKYLVAYVIPAEPRVSDPRPTPTGTELIATLQAYLHTQLPDYMVSTRVVFLDAMPLTPNGKIDRLALEQREVPSLHALENGSAHKTIIAPRTHIEKVLASIWTELLNLEQVSISDHFFEVGGHSLLAVQLLNRINKRFGQWRRVHGRQALSLPMLLQAPTIEQTAALLQKEMREHPTGEGLGTPSPLVVLQPAGEKCPFFCVHPAPGDVYCLLDLAKNLRHDRPFYGLQAPGLRRDHDLFKSIEEMAAAYIGALFAVQPEGPYYLGGYSSGGMVAFEMARQLQAQGQSVALLAILDTYPRVQKASASTDAEPPSLLGSMNDYAEAIPRLVETLDRYWRTKITISYEDLCHLQLDEQLAHFLDRLAEAQVVPYGMDLSQARRYIQVNEGNAFCFRRYQPQPYAGRITLFCSEETEGDPALWTPFSSEPIEVHPVAGDHILMVVEPYVQSLAVQLQQCLDKADGHLP